MGGSCWLGVRIWLVGAFCGGLVVGGGGLSVRREGARFGSMVCFEHRPDMEEE